MARTSPVMYQSRAVRWGPDSFLIVRSRSPWVELLWHDSKIIREHALWAMKLESRYERWHWWQPIPPRMFELDFVEIRFVDRLLGWLIALCALGACCRRGWP